ncbi:hypothetical protein GX50_06887 [[Emmonsia] crescens]|uniref:Uncharacterized protein n=1 Tax=[Emmonsia] crescens TaxID=73230 RepID=A0A2B7ZAU2_9EURO|nr:hypothetical protein GX50_06887 [Emmonsia crescens]
MHRHQDMTTKLHTPYNILQNPLPLLLSRPSYRTNSSALHNSHYARTLVDWNISEDVKNVTAKQHLCSDPLDASVACVLGNPYHLKSEHYLCGDEQSVCGRFSQNALQPSTAVALQQGIKMRFGDHKVCQENKEVKNRGYIPDFVGVACPAQDFTALQKLTLKNPEHQPKMRIVGEAKTAWKHDLKLFYHFYKDEDDKPIRHALGQIATYMHQFEIRYGFLTTYDHTIFIMQEHLGSEPVLCITKPIPAQHDMNSNSLSVRQYLYYLLHCTQKSNSFKFKNSFPIEEWVIENPENIAQMKDPNTPITKHPSPRNEFYQMTPTGRTEMSDSAPLQLHMWFSKKVYRAVLQFPSQQIHKMGSDPYVTISGKEIQVEIIDDSGDEEGEDDDNDDSTTDSGTGQQLQDGRAPRKPSQRHGYPGPQEKSRQYLYDKLKRGVSRSAGTPTGDWSQHVCRDSSPGEDSGSQFFESVPSPSPADRPGPKHVSTRHEYSDPHFFQVVEQTFTSQDPGESAEQRAHHIVEQKQKPKASDVEKSIPYHPKPSKKDDDKGAKKPLSSQFTLGGNRERRHPPKS